MRAFTIRYKDETESAVNAASVSDFTYLETLWTGSFGHFVLAVHNPTNHAKTVKMINEETMTSRRRNMEIEQKIMAAAGQFPFIVKLECVVVDPKWTYLVMPLVSVGNLFDFLAERGTLNEATARFFTAQVCDKKDFRVKPETRNIKTYVIISSGTYYNDSDSFFFFF